MLAQMRNVLLPQFHSLRWRCCAIRRCTGSRLQPGSFVVDPKNGCKVWNPHPQANELVIWSGVCANGFAQGAGNLQWVHDGKPYEKDEGEWNAGQQSGRGTQVWTSGRYEGELVNGEPHGGGGVLTLRNVRYVRRISQWKTQWELERSSVLNVWSKGIGRMVAWSAISERSVSPCHCRLVSSNQGCRDNTKPEEMKMRYFALAAVSMIVLSASPGSAATAVASTEAKGKTCRTEQQCRWGKFQEVCVYVKVCR